MKTPRRTRLPLASSFEWSLAPRLANPSKFRAVDCPKQSSYPSLKLSAMKISERPTTRRKTRIRFDPANPAMTVFRTRYWKPHMVYVLRADKPIRYKSAYSRIVYIGETRRGTRRPAGSAASKAMRTFGVLPGIRRIDVHPLTFKGTQSLRIWEILERDLLATFKAIFGEIPFYNQQGKGKKFSVDGIERFRKTRLEKVVRLLS